MSLSLDGDLSASKKKKVKDEDEFVQGSSAPLIQPIQDGAKSSVDALLLPTGYLDELGKLHREVELRELSGEEEDILVSRKMAVHMRLAKLLENCVQSIGPYTQDDPRWKNVIKDLVATDRLFLILQLRILSLGPIFSAKMKCSACEAFSNQSVDLNDFKIHGLKDPMQRVWEGQLPKSGFKYVAKSQTGWEEAKLAQYSADNKDMMSLAMLGRIVEMNGKSNVSVADLKKLSWADRQALRSDFGSREGDIEKSMEYECQSCGQDNKEDVDIASPNFFFPSETSGS